MDVIDYNNELSKSKDLTKENIERLKELFPEVVTEGKIDFNVLQEVLGKEVQTGVERYQFNWAGKAQARREAQNKSTGTLRPCKEESVNFDSTENMYIEGDNLEVLKLLQKSYSKKIKMIYIDPPYNTGNDFVYNDDYKDNLDNYKRLTGQITEEGLKPSTNSETSGRYHSNWLNMIYPRLKLARNLLSEDGVIFISIDDNEVHNLRKVCDEIFGEENFLGCLPTIMNLKGNNDEFGFAGTHEYTIVYAKNYCNCELYEFKLDEEEFNLWDVDDVGMFKKGAPLRATGDESNRDDRPLMFYPILIKESEVNMITEDEYNKIYDKVNKIFNDEHLEKLRAKYLALGWQVILPKKEDGAYGRWRWGYNYENNNRLKQDVVVNYNGKEITLYKKQRPELADLPSKKPKSVFYKPEYNSGNGTAQIKNLFGEKVFKNPKPVDLMKDLISISINETETILDFFSGSCSTAHAVMELNKEDGGNRKFICVQLPEQTPKESEAYKAGYKTIAEIGKERIRRVINKLKTEDEGKLKFEEKKIDLGFKVFKLDSSNIISWDPETKDLEKSLFESSSNIKMDRTEYDVIFEILLKYGLPLTVNMEVLQFENTNIYIIGNGELFICLADINSLNIADKIVEIKEKLNPEICRVVFKDTSFANDIIKTNTQQILLRNNVDKVESI